MGSVRKAEGQGSSFAHEVTVNKAVDVPVSGIRPIPARPLNIKKPDAFRHGGKAIGNSTPAVKKEANNVKKFVVGRLGA